MYGSLVLDGAGDATVSEERKSFDVYDLADMDSWTMA